MEAKTTAPFCSGWRCADRPYCAAPCVGYGTTNSCPPLIVLAVLSSEQLAMDASGVCR
jgi:hypothetical protein